MRSYANIKLINYRIGLEQKAMMKYWCKDINKNKLPVIRQVAGNVDMVIAPYIYKNVVDGIKYEYMDVPCGRRQFYEYVRYFFILLWEVLQNGKVNRETEVIY